MASDRPSSGPRRRTTNQASTNISTTRRSPTTTTTTATNDTNLPPAPDPPTWSPSPSHPQVPSTSTHQPTTQDQAYQMPPASTTTSTRRSPSPIPPPPGAPRITPLSDLDIEDELKELVGIDRGYLRLGPRPLTPRQPTPGQGTTTTTDQPTDQDNSTSKIDSQLNFAMQYIVASRNRGAPAASRAERTGIEYPSSESEGHYGYYHLHHHQDEYHQQQQEYRHVQRRKQLRLQYPDGRVEMRYLLR